MNSRSGYIMVIVVLVIAAVMVVIVPGVVLRSLAQVEHAQVRINGHDAAWAAQSCVQEGLIMLNRDASVTTGTVPLALGTCSFVAELINEDTQGVVTSTGQVGEYTQRITVHATLNPFTIVRWGEAGLQ